MIIQNSDSIFLRWDDDHRQIYFPKERISGKKIKHLLLLNGKPAGTQIFAPTGEKLTDLYFTNHYSKTNPDLIDVYDQNDNHILDGYCLEQLAFYKGNEYAPTWEKYGVSELFTLDSVINPSLSNVRISDTHQLQIGENSQIVCLVAIYDCEQNLPEVISTNVISFLISSNDKKINLSDITGYALRDKKVKKIVMYGENVLDSISPYYPTYSVIDKYLTIKTFDGNNINQIPTLFLSDFEVRNTGYGLQANNYRRRNDITFDNLRIDEDNSFIENPMGTYFNGKISFYY